MTESDLFCYLEAKNSLKRAEEAFSETVTMYQPPTSNISFMPKDHSDDVEKVTGSISLKDSRRILIQKAQQRLEDAFRMLVFVSDNLVLETDKEFLWNHYYHGLTYQDIENKSGRSQPSLYRDRKRVLSQIKNLNFNERSL